MRAFVVVITCAVAAACGAGAVGGSSQAVAGDPGALVKMELGSTVGVLLDEVPPGPQRERAATAALALPAASWERRARAQVKLTYYRLVFRGEYYSGAWSNGGGTKDRGPLPLPPEEVWTVSVGSPRRAQVGAHDYVLADYSFVTHQLTDAASPGVVEPGLATVGGTWDEAFSLPLDPELLLQRTGYACMDEDEYPPHSVFEENTWYFYDDSCKQEPATSASCHITQFPQESCVVALDKHVGAVKTAIHFTRVPWSDPVANAVRVGTISSHPGADLAVVPAGMSDERRVMYRYFAGTSCELDEGVIAAPGWRQLLAFSAVVRNDGSDRLHIGDVSDPANPWLAQNIFQWSACHGHYHFTHYGEFNWAGAPGSKRAFCLEDTNRFHNDEATPLWAEHQSCFFQGIGHGWGDEYEFGIPGQWVDVTDVVAGASRGVTADLTFRSNPDRFLCEGEPMPSAAAPAFVDSGFRTSTGQVVGREQCDSWDSSSPWTGWDANNLGTAASVTIRPGDSFVTAPCSRDQLGPNRDCGFGAGAALRSCAPGSQVSLACAVARGGGPQVVRVCERSERLGVGVACALADAAANAIVDGSGTVTFACPAVRDSASGAGGYAVYSGALLPADPAASVTCR